MPECALRSVATWATWGLHMGQGNGDVQPREKMLGPGGTHGGCRWLKGCQIGMGEVLLSVGVAVIISSRSSN